MRCRHTAKPHTSPQSHGIQTRRTHRQTLSKSPGLKQCSTRAASWSSLAPEIQPQCSKHTKHQESTRSFEVPRAPAKHTDVESFERTHATAGTTTSQARVASQVSHQSAHPMAKNTHPQDIPPDNHKPVASPNVDRNLWEEEAESKHQLPRATGPYGFRLRDLVCESSSLPASH